MATAMVQMKLETKVPKLLRPPPLRHLKLTPPANNHARKVRLTLEDAILGCTRTLRGHYAHTRNACVGKGQHVLAKACSTCRGSSAGRKTALFGWLWNSEECADCGGDGRQRARLATPATAAVNWPWPTDVGSVFLPVCARVMC